MTEGDIKPGEVKHLSQVTQRVRSRTETRSHVSGLRAVDVASGSWRLSSVWIQPGQAAQGPVWLGCARAQCGWQQLEAIRGV